MLLCQDEKDFSCQSRCCASLCWLLLHSTYGQGWDVKPES